MSQERLKARLLQAVCDEYVARIEEGNRTREWPVRGLICDPAKPGVFIRIESATEKELREFVGAMMEEMVKAAEDIAATAVASAFTDAHLQRPPRSIWPET